MRHADNGAILRPDEVIGGRSSVLHTATACSSSFSVSRASAGFYWQRWIVGRCGPRGVVQLLLLVQRFQNINMLGVIFLFRRDVVRGGVGIGLGGSNGSTSSSDCAAERCGTAATFGGDFSVSDGAHEPCRTGADYSGLFGGAVGLRSGPHDWGDAADSDTLPGASGRTGGDRGTG